MRFRVCPLLLILILGLMKEMLTICPGGFEREGKKRVCIDYDECALEENICGQNANCKNTNGSYYCTCHEGFEPRVHFTQDDGKKCRDFNECRANRTVCGANAECHNTIGSYECRCKLGYNSSDGSGTFKAGRGVQCIDMDECSKSSVCGIKRECHNTPGGFYCSCGAGFRLDSGQTNSTETSQSCRKIKCEDFIIDNTAKQKVPGLSKLVSVMNNSCVLLGNSEIVRNHSIQMDGKTLLEGFLNALDDLLQGELQDFHSKASTVFSIVESVMKLAGALLDEGHTRTSQSKTEVEMFVNRGSSSSGGPLMVSVSGAQFSSHWDTAAGNTNLGFVTAALLSYSGLEESLSSFSDDLGKGQFKINSKVVTATVSNPDTEHLDKAVMLTFTHLQRSDRTHVCVFWDPKVKQGAWSASGCTRVNSTEDLTICSCDHLSSFAVLMALYDIGDVYELSVVTRVGLSLSLICLLICIATFYLVRSIQSTRNTIHLHLSICLFIAYFVFLVGINRTENEVGCSVVAVLLHYSFLASFCWMCLEGVQLFRMVVLVFNTTVRPLYLFVAGYGVPAVIVSVSAMVKAGGYGTESYCWLSLKDGFIWSFYGPVCLIIMANAFFFLITIWKLAGKFSSLNPDLNNLRKIKTFTITAVAQLCVLGLTWVFGCFQFDSSSLATSYIFTILGSLQGALMFLMHCCLSKQVKEEYAKVLLCFHTPQKRKYSEFSSNQTGKTQPSRSAQHTGESHF